jgi:NAD(P)-dependent dehydrogenase (short-subunit alcohol dehydrogenase family)
MAARLEGKAAVVVGAGQTPGDTIGNGRAISLLFAREGAHVICVDAIAERAQETASMIAREGGRAGALRADICKVEDCGRIVSEAIGSLGRIDILVNNVGVVGPGTAVTTEESLFNRVMHVNIKGMWVTIKAVLPRMREQGHGAIVNISSVAGIVGCTNFPYELSKAAVNRMTTSVAASNADRGVRCNAILPGLMDTPMGISGAITKYGLSAAEAQAARAAKVPLSGKQGTGWDTAYAALFLASDEAKFVTGVLLPVDGGISIVNVLSRTPEDMKPNE